MKTIETIKRRKFTKAFKILAAKRVLNKECSSHDFLGYDGQPIHYGNVEIWVSEYLAGKYTAKPPMRAAKADPKSYTEKTLEGSQIAELAIMFAHTVEKAKSLQIENERLRNMSQPLFHRRKEDQQVVAEYVQR